MFNILSCCFPASPSATQESVLNAVWLWTQSSARYAFSELDAPAHFPFRQIHQGGNNRLELLGCVIDDTNFTAIRMTKPDSEKNALWRMDMIFAKPKTGQPTISVQLGRSPIDPELPCNLTDTPCVPVLLNTLREKRLIQTKAVSLPTIRIGNQSASKLKRKLRHQVFPLAWIQDVPEGLPNDAAVQIVWDTCNVCRDYILCPGADETADAVTMQIFSLVGQVHGNLPMDFDLLSRLCPNTNNEMTDMNANYCYMNKAMAAKLRTTRREIGMSQESLANAVNVRNLVISRMETLRVSRAPVALVRSIEQVLGLPANAILSLQAEPQEEAAPEQPPIPEVPAPVAEHSAPVQKNLFCRLCGAKLYEDSRFCSNCGGAVLP